MLAFTVLAGCPLLAQAHRIQPEAARLAPQVNAVSLGYQEVPAITLGAMRTVSNVDVANPWGVRDPSRILASRASMELVEDAVQDLEPHSNTDVLLQDEFLPFGMMLVDAGTVSQAETKALTAEPAEASTKLASSRSKFTEAEALAIEADFLKEVKDLENLKAKLEKDLEKQQAKIAKQVKNAADPVKVDAQAQKDTSTKESAVAVKSVADKGAPAVVGKIETQPGSEKVEPQKDAAGTVKVEAQAQKDTKKADMGDAKAVAATQAQEDTKKADTKDAKVVSATPAGAGQKDSRQKFAEAKDKFFAAKAELDASRAELEKAEQSLKARKQEYAAVKEKKFSETDGFIKEFDAMNKKELEAKQAALEKERAALEKEKQEVEEMKKELEALRQKLVEQQDILTSTISSSST